MLVSHLQCCFSVLSISFLFILYDCMTASFCNPLLLSFPAPRPARRPMAMTTPAMPATEGAFRPLTVEEKVEKRQSDYGRIKDTLRNNRSLTLRHIGLYCFEEKVLHQPRIAQFPLSFTRKLIRQPWPITCHSLLQITGINFYLFQTMIYPRQ